MSDFLSDDKEYLKKLEYQQAHILGAFMAVAYWEYVLALNPEFARLPGARKLTNRWRDNRLYAAVEDFLDMNMQKFFTSIANEYPEYAAELNNRLTSIEYYARDAWEQAHKNDPDIPELIFPIIEPTIKENQQ